MHFHWSRAGPTREAVICTTVERWPKTVYTIVRGRHFCTERRKQQARLVACGSNTPPRPPLEQQPGVVVMHLHDRLRARTHVDCTAPITERGALVTYGLHCYFVPRLPPLEGFARLPRPFHRHGRSVTGLIQPLNRLPKV